MKKIFFFYTIFLIIFVLFSYAFVDPYIPYLRPLFTGLYTSQRSMVTASYIAFIIIFFAFYIYVLRLAIRHAIKIKDVWRFIGVTVGILIFSYPAMLSYDIFNYMTTAKVLYLYRENPYVTMPIEIPNEPFLTFTRASNKIALYGPTWLFLSAIPYGVGFGNFFLTVLGFKALVVGFYIGLLSLVWRVTRDVSSIVFLGLNPLVIIETIVSGHNDVVMIFLAVLAIIGLQKKKYLSAFLLLILSVFIKYATIFLIPVFLYVFWKRKEMERDKLFFILFICMLIIFFLSPFREELYPWYAIWFLPFLSLVKNKNYLKIAIIVFSFGLMLRYIPFMLLGTYAWPTPIIKIMLTWIPLSVFLIVSKLRGRII